MTIELDRHEREITKLKLVVGIEPDSSNLDRTITKMESTKLEPKLKLFYSIHKGEMHDERKGNKDGTKKDRIKGAHIQNI